ncbi:hypothetical protein [Flavobacterium sp. LB2R40]|uniref:hypothetical protein n=1 Tax=unclassified Flavobacterium TaxID=196869 RepID=UPI003AAFA470
MKILSLLFLTIFLGNGCDSAKAQDIETVVIEYTANTRGFYQKITIKNKMVTVSKDREGNDKPVPTKISDANWKELVTCFKTVPLDTLGKLKAPTDKRFYDGAAIGNLKIIVKDKIYGTTGFDHGFPPKEIKKFINIITSLVKKE